MLNTLDKLCEVSRVEKEVERHENVINYLTLLSDYDINQRLHFLLFQMSIH